MTTSQHAKWSRRYRRCMGKVWMHPDNDQRAAVLSWLPSRIPAGAAIVDVGAGDGYYAPVLRPRRYLVAEPDLALRRRCLAACEGLDMEAAFFPSLVRLFASGLAGDAEVVLLVHSLFYLSFEELQFTLRLVQGRSCVVVYPDPDTSATVRFEDEIGSRRSRALVDAMRASLGPPKDSTRVATHLRFPYRTRSSDVAFVLGHLMLRDASGTGILAKALAYVREYRTNWRTADGGWALPQSQIMEWWQRV